MKDIVNYFITESKSKWNISRWVDDTKGINIDWENTKYICICPDDQTIVPFTDDDIEDLEDNITKNIKNLKLGESYITNDDDIVITYIKIK